MQLIYLIVGWPLGWIMWACYKVVPVYAVALVLFTLIMRVLLVPFSIKQQKSMVKMQMFRPRMEELQKKYGNNKERLNEEMMKLYQEENYNPMSGCLPMLIQFPILFGLIDVIYKPMSHILRIGQEVLSQAYTIAAPILDVAPEMLSKDMTAQLKVMGAVQQNPQAFASLGDFVDKVNSINLTIGPIDLTQTPTFALNWLLLIPILSGLTSLALSMFTMKQTAASAGDSAQAAGMTRGMILMMPLMSAYFGFMFPAGVGIYWIISNLLMAIQTFLLNKFMNPVKLAEQAKLEYEAKREQQRKEKIEAKKRARENGELDIDKALSQKEINRMKLAAARKRDAEKYGDIYKEVTDDDLK